MKTWIKQGLPTALLLAAASVHAAPVIGALDGNTAAQSAVTAGQYDRWDTSFAFQASDLAVLTGASSQAFSAPLRAVGSSVTVQYLGTLAAHPGTLFLAGAGDLFSLRGGLDAAVAATDFSAFIDSVGQSLTISNLSAFDVLAFGLLADVYAGSSSPDIAASAGKTVLSGADGGARMVSLGGNEWLIGFETFGATDYADAVVRVSGASLAGPPPPTASLPAPGGLPLTLLTLVAAGWTLRRPRRAGAASCRAE